MLLEGAILISLLGGEVNKSMKLDAQAVRKNARAFTKSADAQYKLEQCQRNLLEKLEVNARRKNAILTCHLKMFQEQYAVIRAIRFKKGRGIEELQQIEDIQKKVTKYVSMPAISSGKIMNDAQLLISIALRGIGGVMIQESKENLQLASRNLSKANAMAAQADTLCTALNGISRHVEIVTQLLEKLGMLYIKSIKNMEKILQTNGMDAEKYSEEDIRSINLSLDLTKLIYRIINTPMIDSEGKIEQESARVIQRGQEMLDTISKGEM